MLSCSFQDTLSFSPQLLSRLRGLYCAGYGVSLSPVLCMAPAECHAWRGTQNVCRNRQQMCARASGCGSSPGRCHHPNPPDLSSRTFCRATRPSSIPPAPMALVSGAPELEPVRAPPPPWTFPQPTSDPTDLLKLPAFQSHRSPTPPPSRGCLGPRHILPGLPGRPRPLAHWWGHILWTLPSGYLSLVLPPALRWSCQRLPSSVHVHSQSSHWLALLLGAPDHKAWV